MEFDQTESSIDVSVALLTRNAGSLLQRALGAVRGQRTQRRVEFVAVDSGSTDGTRDLLRANGARVFSIPPEEFSFGRTRDLLFEQTRGPLVVSLSQDAVPAHDGWLEKLLEPLDNPEIAAACGPSIPDPDRSYRQFPWEANGYFYFTREMRRFVERYGRGLSNANSAIRRDVWNRLRFGEQSIGEDFRFQTKLHSAGLLIAFPSDATVYHHHDYAMAALWRRCRNEGMGLRELDCGYEIADLVADLASPGKYRVWLKELLRGRLDTPAALAFPVARPLAVYVGSRSGKSFSR